MRALHRSGEKRARGVRGCEWSMRAGNRPLAARLPAHLLPLTQGSPLCGSRMCPWLRCVDLLAVAACSTPRFYSERAKSPAWTFLPSPLPPLAPSRASAPAHTPAKLCIPSPIPSSPPRPIRILRRDPPCSRSLSRILSRWSMETAWKPDLSRSNAREEFLRARQRLRSLAE